MASIWYLLVTTVLTIGQYYLERHYGRGDRQAGPESIFERLRRIVFPRSEAPGPPSASGERR